MFQELLDAIYSKEFKPYSQSITELITFIDKLTRQQLLDIITQIGIIPERIAPSSTLEKLYTKVSEILLAKTFNELGFLTEVIQTRSNTGDILVTSHLNYSVMVDCKCFRATRTAKNQKDFKMASLSSWKKENTYALLVMPEHQITKNHQIYKQAIDYNVQIIYWETLAMLLHLGIKEPNINLKDLFVPKEGIISTETILYEVSIDCDVRYLELLDTQAIERYDYEKEQILNQFNNLTHLSKQELLQLLKKELKIDKKLDILEKEKQKRI